jgi:hypothetical protein
MHWFKLLLVVSHHHASAHSNLLATRNSLRYDCTFAVAGTTHHYDGKTQRKVAGCVLTIGGMFSMMLESSEAGAGGTGVPAIQV